MFYVHTTTGQVVRKGEHRPQSSAKHAKAASLSGDVDVAQTALKRKVFHYTQEELDRRKGLMGSSRCVLDRQKYAREFRLIAKRDGTSELLHNQRTVVATLSKDQTELYQQNPHIQQVFANGRQFSRADHAFGIHDRSAQYDAEGMSRLSSTGVSASSCFRRSSFSPCMDILPRRLCTPEQRPGHTQAG